MTRPAVDPDLGDLIIALLAGSLAGLRDHLAEEGFANASDLVGDLVDIADDYVTRSPVTVESHPATRPPPRAREDRRPPPGR